MAIASHEFGWRPDHPRDLRGYLSSDPLALIARNPVAQLAWPMSAEIGVCQDAELKEFGAVAGCNAGGISQMVTNECRSSKGMAAKEWGVSSPALKVRKIQRMGLRSSTLGNHRRSARHRVRGARDCIFLTRGRRGAGTQEGLRG